jgi:hypothetical protein
MSFRLLVVATAAFCASAQAAQPAEADVAKLVRAIRVDDIARLGMQLSAEDAFQRGKASAAQIACIRDYELAPFTDAIARTLATRLSDAEIVAGRRFFETDLGVRYASYMVSQLYRAVGAPMPLGIPVPSFSDEDRRALDAFSHTPGGSKLIDKQHSVFIDPAVRSASVPVIVEAMTKCKDVR